MAFVMSVRKPEKSDLRSYFDHLSKILIGGEAEIEVASLARGDQSQARWPPLLGLVYDPKENVVEVAIEGCDHLIYKPQVVNVDDGLGQLTNIEIIDADGVRRTVKLKEAVMPPAPRA